jgi:hypothetical protein
MLLNDTRNTANNEVPVAFKKEEPSQPRPAMDISATIPAFMMLPLTVATGDARKISMFRPAAASMTIMIAGAISTCSMCSSPATEAE